MPKPNDGRGSLPDESDIRHEDFPLDAWDDLIMSALKLEASDRDEEPTPESKDRVDRLVAEALKKAETLKKIDDIRTTEH